MRPLFVGRVENAFHPAIAHYDEIPAFCKEIATKILYNHRIIPGSKPGDRDGAGAYRVGYQGQNLNRVQPAVERRLDEAAAHRRQHARQVRFKGTGWKGLPAESIVISI
jgi:hypothetical protein